MVSTRQQSNVSSSGDNSGTESGGTTKSLRHTSSTPSQSTQCSDLVSVTINSLSQPYVSNAKLLDLPHEVLEKIFSFLGFRNVSQLRLVCRQMDHICSAILNSTFQRLQTQMLHRFQGIKSKMPRRESARRNHPLACESDIIETLHMRLTLLQMSFGKHIERKHCCFFAGEILDEVYRILHYIKVTPKLARPYKVTDELFDLSTMAMEYFKEHIEPTLPEIAYFGSDFLDFGALPSTSSSKYMCFDSPPHGTGKGDESPGHNASHCEDRQVTTQTNMVLRKRIRKIKQGMKRYNYQLSQLRKEVRHCRGKIADQQKQILEYATRLDEYDKKNEETSRKFSTLLQDDARAQNQNTKSSCQSLSCGRLNVSGFHQDFCSLDHLGKELNKCKTELQYWRSKSPLNPLCVSCGTAIAPVPSEDLEALANQGVLLSEFVAEEPPIFLPPLPAALLPGTSADDVWTSWEHEEKEMEKAAEARSKRKSTTSSEQVLGKNGPPPSKKPRNVLKARSKR